MTRSLGHTILFDICIKMTQFSNNKQLREGEFTTHSSRLIPDGRLLQIRWETVETVSSLPGFSLTPRLIAVLMRKCLKS
jgi:hypothetical protein